MKSPPKIQNLRAHEHIHRTTLYARTDKDRPQVWFTLNQFWEPTVEPGLQPIMQKLRDDADVSAYIKIILAESGGGWVRFGLPASSLYPVSITSPLPYGEANQEIANNHRVSFKDVAVDNCLIESMDADLEWARVYTPKQSWNAWLH